MKMRVARAILAVALAVGVSAAFLAWRYPFPFSLMWPGIALARLGVSHAWIFPAALMTSLLVWIGLWARRKAWWQAAGMSVLASAGYCALAWLYATRLPVPLPAVTPYDSEPERRRVFLESYDLGYRGGMLGHFPTFCFRPEVETRGFYEGSHDGGMVWHRLMGWKIPAHFKRRMERAAAIDGIKLELKGSEAATGDGANDR